MAEELVTLREHLDQRFVDLERHLTSKIEAVATASAIANEVAKQAVTKAEIAVERRLEALNELRELVGDYQRTLMPRAEATQRFTDIDAKIDKLETTVEARTAHSGGVASAMGWVIAAIAAIVAILSFAMR